MRCCMLWVGGWGGWVVMRLSSFLSSTHPPTHPSTSLFQAPSNTAGAWSTTSWA